MLRLSENMRKEDIMWIRCKSCFNAWQGTICELVFKEG